MLTLPNILTLSRIFAVPILVVPAVASGLVRLCAGLRALRADRASPIISTAMSRARRARFRKLGIFLDPIADKIMVAAVIVMLVAFDSVATASR